MIGLDFDGVIYDIGPVVATEASNLLGRTIGVMDFFKHNISECLDITEEQTRSIIDACWDSKWFKGDRFITGALDGLRLLLKLGQPIIIITARPHTEMVKEYILNYIDTDPALLSVYYTHSKDKGPLAVDLKLSMFVDDHFVSLDSIAEYNIKPILFNAPWNQYPTQYHRVMGWDEVCVIINDRVYNK